MSRPRTAETPRSTLEAAERRRNWLLVLSAVLLTLLIVSAVVWTLGRIQSQARLETAESLQTVVGTTREGIQLWVDSITAQISVFVRRRNIVSAVETRLNSRSEREQTAAAQQLMRLLKPVFETYNYFDFCLIRPDGVQINGPGADPRSKLSDPLAVNSIRSALEGTSGVTLFSTEESDVLVIAAPVRSGDRIIGALALFMDPTGPLKDITSFARPGKTAETYVFNHYGRILTGSRFATPAEGSVYLREGFTASPRTANPPFTRMARSALDGNSGVDVNGYPDYRNMIVFGAWEWDKVLDVGVATEMDRNEALRTYRATRTLTLWMLAIIGAGLIGLLGVLIDWSKMATTNYALRQAANARKDTMAVVSHDLRAPLNNVMLCAQMISGTRSEDPSVTRLASMINRSGRRMERLIADLLDVSEMEAGYLRIKKQTCDVAPLCDAVRDTFIETADSKGIHFTVVCPPEAPPILADPDRIGQVLSNLVANAIKFTPRQGRVSVNVTASSGDVVFEVRDTGPGIPAEEVPHIFERFWKTENSGKSGRGLGLYIAKTIVQHHGGRIWVETAPEAGSAFFFTIPRSV